ncbi:MAG TPA: sialidase family protein [Pseudomonadales bacterium]|nr:sialidase family protein [Pseudomonadales bacterium]
MALIVSAQTWTKTGAPTNSWTCIASSANGSNLIAGAGGGPLGGPLYRSTNSGTTWKVTYATNEYWGSVASSADGTHLFAAAPFYSTSGPGGLYISTNSGAKWMTNNLPALYWSSVASSADGRTLVAVASAGAGGTPGGGIFSTTNGGISWITTNFNNANPWGVAMSADGRKMFAVSGEVSFRSTNSGVTWTKQTNTPYFAELVSPSQYIASSADGNKLVLAVTASTYGTSPQSYDEIYISTDFGDSWGLAQTVSNTLNFVTSSADGKILAAVPLGSGPIFVSTNSGVTWTTNNSPTNQQWGAVASCADGGKLLAAAGNAEHVTGPIYLSRSVQPPWADIMRTNGHVMVSWFVPSTNFTLLQSSNLLKWTTVTNKPVFDTHSARDEVTLVITNKPRFYRLKLQ